MKKKWLAGALCGLGFALFLCVGDVKADVETTPAPTTTVTPVTPAAIVPTQLRISATSKTLYTGQRYDINIKSIAPANAKKSVTWISTNKNIATVDTMGVVTAKRSGTVYITAKCKLNSKVQARCKVKVRYGVANKSITINKKSATLYEGKTLKLSVSKWNPTNTKVKTVSWSSSDKKVATVSASGTVKAKAAGTATITAKNTYGKCVTCKITVKYEKVTSVKLDKRSLTLKRGDTLQLKATVSPTKAKYQKVTFTSSDPAIAIVDENGFVTCLTEGTVVITATEHDGKYAAQCTIHIIE